MRHFIAYHNTDEMGLLSNEGTPGVFTSKPVKNLQDSTVYIISGTGAPRRYCLANVFKVNKIEDAANKRFKWLASGNRSGLRQHVEIRPSNWFAGLKRSAGNFAFGLCEIKDASVIASLQNLAAKNRYKGD